MAAAAAIMSLSLRETTVGCPSTQIAGGTDMTTTATTMMMMMLLLLLLLKKASKKDFNGTYYSKNTGINSEHSENSKL